MLDYQADVLDVLIEGWQYAVKNRPDVLGFIGFDGFYVEDVLIGGKTYRVPVVLRCTEDRGVIPTTPLDIAFPTVRNWLLSNTVSVGRFPVIENGMQERVLSLPSYDGQDTIPYLKQCGLKSIARYLKEPYALIETDNRELIESYLLENAERWRVRAGQPLFTEFIETEVEAALKAGHQFFVFRNHEGHSCLREVVSDGNGMLYSINCYRSIHDDHTSSRIGNTSLLAIIYHAARSLHTKVNLGIDIFDYKKMWTDEVIPVKGLALP